MNKKIKNIVMFVIFSLLLISLTTISYAVSFIPGISSTSVKVGDTITITVKADNAAGMYNVKVGDSSILEVTSGATSEFLENNSATIKLKAKKAGTTTISVTPDDMTDLDDSTKQVTTGGKTYTVKVAEVTTSSQDKGTTTNKDTTTEKKEETTTPEKPKEKSNNANLSTLGVTPKEYDFSGFSKNKTEYSVTVPKNVDSLKVLYKTADSNATVKITGNSGFEVGSDNKITIKVTAEDGKTTKTYTIKVTQLAEEEEKPGNVIEDESRLYLTKLYIDAAQLSPEFSEDIYYYTATLNDTNINELLIEAEANNKDAKIDISGHTNLVEGENTVNIILTMDDSDIQTVYQVVVTAYFTEEVVESSSQENVSNTGDFIGTIKKYAGILIGVIAFIIIAVIVLTVLLIKENKKIQEDDECEKTPKRNSRRESGYKEEFVNNDMQRDNFIESLYNQRNGTLYDYELTNDDKETIEEINKQTEKIFEEKSYGQSVEHTSNDIENPLEIRNRRRNKGKHSL